MTRFSQEDLEDLDRKSIAQDREVARMESLCAKFKDLLEDQVNCFINMSIGFTYYLLDRDFNGHDTMCLSVAMTPLQNSILILSNMMIQPPRYCHSKKTNPQLSDTIKHSDLKQALTEQEYLEEQERLAAEEEAEELEEARIEIIFFSIFRIVHRFCDFFGNLGVF